MWAEAGCALVGLGTRMLGSVGGKPMTGRTEEVEGRSMFMTVYCRGVFNRALKNCLGARGLGTSICTTFILFVLRAVLTGALAVYI